MRKIIIIGNGIAGITAARHIRKRSDDPITIISDETDHFFSRTALMYVYMGHMKYQHIKPYEDWFWPKNRLDLIRDRVIQVETEKKELKLQGGEKLAYDVLIIATGSKPNAFGWPGQDLSGVQGLYSYQDLESMEANTRGIRRAIVVGGGLIGIEMCEMLLTRNIPVSFLVRESSFWNVVLPGEESALINDHIRQHQVDLRLDTELGEILDDGKGGVRGVRTGKGEEIEGQFVGLAVGVHPNIDFLRDTAIESDKGVLVNAFFETNIPDVYAIGDCAQHREPPPGRKPVEQVWYTGRIQGETLALSLTGEKKAYQPGPWFNSAKFFDIEYQTYGEVPPDVATAGNSVYWQDDRGRRAIRLVYDGDDLSLKGVNLLGVRFRHEVCNRWIIEKKTIHEVMKAIEKAGFDAEFSPDPLNGLRKSYQKQFPGHPLPQSTKKGLVSFFSSNQ